MFTRHNFFRKFVSSGNEKKNTHKHIKVKTNKPVYPCLSILEIRKTLMYEFWHDFIKPKYQRNGHG